ncbi:prenyltransferase/squalene oxidase repeat-containing protein [Streptomyces sp. ME19-01-6]|uniref:prenyltransferase/squalene oxidase repeat-containing protein n=1 Tax=Streptomyces sp. ME19-01-6 TaxID=3028686 RepID=UPI0029AFA603|nr:prenyltransferase/squalene oxidase repeat-containing protein [Streptomyces sp. ME19-01-6]MDX3224803.1 prenyltransferase/squalene oxidase repeat-containing protein [Streptomyces sp. ME19-01-6]
MNVRRSATALAALATLCTAAAPAAFADASPSPKPSGSSALPKGLYGTKDPKFDGVWRQSLALLAQDAVGVTPARSAIDWLAGQQCEDGGFAAYRADAAKSCDPKKGEFTDATAAAVQALAAVGGRSAAVEKGVGWLKKHQNDDGGWGMNPGSPSDANSTSAAVGAFAAIGQDPKQVKSAKGGKTPYDVLLGLQLGCEAKEGQRGAFAYTAAKGDPGKKTANDLATAAAALATEGKGFVFEPAGKDDGKAPKPLNCGAGKGGSGKPDGAAEAAQAAAAYLSDTMTEHGRHLLSAMPGAKAQPDFGGTADAIVALAAGEHSATAAKPLQWLQSEKSGALAWAKGDPGALAKLVLAAHAAGADPRSFGSVDLVQRLNATGPKPESVSAAGSQSDSGKDSESGKDEKDDDKGGVGGVWWTVGVFLVAGIGIGFLLSGRKKQQL